MPEQIFKLQPDRTIQLRGFDRLGASAAMHSATSTGFKVSGIFRDPADFAVLVLWDADNFYEHPRLKYLPDMDFSGLVLAFDVQYTGLMPLDCTKYPTIAWPFLEVIREDGTTARIRLTDHAAAISGGNSPATASFVIQGANLEAFDRLTLWYQNIAFDYQVPGKLSTVMPFYAGGEGTTHTITVASQVYSYTEGPDQSSAEIAAALIARVNGEAGGYPADPNVTAEVGADPWLVKLTRKLDTGDFFAVASTNTPSESLWHVKETTVCRKLAEAINAVNYSGVQTPFALQATASGTTLTISTTTGGYDANFITLYSVATSTRLKTEQPTATLRGGASNTTYRVTLDFEALGVPRIRTMWLTFAPPLEDSGKFQAREWEATFSNWTVTGSGVRLLQVAGPDSERIASADPRCTYSPGWSTEAGFYMDNLARRCDLAGQTVTIRYHCPKSHRLWIGTSLYSDRGSVAVDVDGINRGSFSAYLENEPAVITRRCIAPDLNLAAGEHVVTLTAIENKPFYFDFLEAVVPSDIPDNLPALTKVSPALDYSTDHTYKLPPARIVWNLQKLGYAGPVNEYIGVFWWNQRKRINENIAKVVVTFTGDFAAGDAVFLNIGGQLCGKSVFPAETRAIIADHFKYLINARYVGVWAESDGDRLTIHSRSPEPAYSYPFTASVTRVAGSTGDVSFTGSLVNVPPAPGSTQNLWQIDPEQTPAINRGARDWHRDLYSECAARGLPVLTACSMELVFPPPEFAACYPDGQPVATQVGFADLVSTHCSFNAPMRSYHAAVYDCLAGLMESAGLTPMLQFGEFTWWYFTNQQPSNPSGGMAYYDAETSAAAVAALGRPLHRFTNPNDDPLVNGSADSNFLRNRLRDYVAQLITEIKTAHPTVRFEILFPYDVNYPAPAGVNNLGGRLNRHVNLPPEWENPTTCEFDYFKLEALDFGAWTRDLDLSRDCQEFPLQLGWPPDKVRAMIPVFRGGYNWQEQVKHALELGMDSVNLWAFDHICLYAWRVGPLLRGRAVRFR